MEQFPPAFRHIHLELAREPDHPAGDSGHGYDILAPLTDEGHLDAETWRAHKHRCRVRRFRPAEESSIGVLRHGPGRRWYIDYDPGSDADDEPGYRFEDERFVPGEYVSIREDDGVIHTFRVTAVRTLD